MRLFPAMASSLEQSLLRLVKKLIPGAEQEPLDPARFGDSLAERVAWTPLVPGGANFATHCLKKLSEDRVAFRKTFTMILFALVFLLPGLAIFCGAVLANAGVSLGNGIAGWPALLGGAIFSAAGFFLLRSARTVEFDRQCGWFYRGKKPTDPEASGAGLLLAIHALQIISEHCSGSRGSSYRSYELNLVLKDGTRVNVIDHGSISKMREDAFQLSQFLGVPVWDATS